MIPSRTWFPLSLQERAAWLDNFATNFANVAPGLGFGPADITGMTADNLVFQFMASTATTIEAYSDAVRQFRRVITEGNIGDATPDFPADVSFTPPPSRPTGLFERLDDVVKRARVAPAYTAEIGALLGIIPSSPGSVVEADVKPTIEVFPAATGYMFSIVVAGRAKSDQWQVWVTPAGSTNWTNAMTATGKSADVVYQPSTLGQPVQLQIRVQLRRANQDYGQLSEIAQATVNP